MPQPLGEGAKLERLFHAPIGRLLSGLDFPGFHPSTQIPGQRCRVVRRGVAWDSWGGEATVCPWAERGGDSSRRGGRRMRALRVRAHMGRAGAPTLEAFTLINTP